MRCEDLGLTSKFGWKIMIFRIIEYPMSQKRDMGHPILCLDSGKVGLEQIQGRYKRKTGNISGRQATAKARTKAKYGDSSLRSE